MKLRHFCIVVSLAMLARVAYAADAETASVPEVNAAEALPQPKARCTLPCIVMKVSTRCVCRLHDSLPTMAIT